ARFNCTWTINRNAIVDKAAAVLGDDSCIDTPKAGGPSGEWKGHWLTVYQQQADGSWMIVRDSAEDARLQRASEPRWNRSHSRSGLSIRRSGTSHMSATNT